MVLDTKLWMEKCTRMPSNVVDVVVEMGQVTDYFRPIPKKKVCDMLLSSQLHEWSGDGMKWVKPEYTTNTDVLGGSVNDFPKEAIADDSRMHLSTWGSKSGRQRGGCCSMATNEYTQTWGRPFTMYIRTGECAVARPSSQLASSLPISFRAARPS